MLLPQSELHLQECWLLLDQSNWYNCKCYQPLTNCQVMFLDEYCQHMDMGMYFTGYIQIYLQLISTFSLAE